LGFELVDPRELELPSVGTVVFRDPESGRVVELPTSRASFRREYAKLAATRRSSVAATLRDSGCDHAVLSTDRDWVRDVAGFLLRRRRLATSAARSVRAIGS
jgi:uncharacterized protein (DUF58 family)